MSGTATDAREDVAPEITVVAVEARRIAVVRRTVILADLPKAQREARDLLDAALESAGVRAVARRSTVWRPPQDGAMDYAPGIFVPDDFEPSGAVSLFTLPEGRAAHLRMRGSYAGLPDAWKRLFAGMTSRTLVPIGLNWEVYALPGTPPETAETDLYAFLA